jgi:hypothetical protein
MKPEVLETSCEWMAEDVVDPARWTEILSDDEVAELDRALDVARAKSSDFLEIGKEDFPLPTLGPRLEQIERELMNGRGFVLLRGLPRERYTNDDMCLAYWGIGAHLGKPWPQNHHGHLLGDVVDQGKTIADPTARGNELGQIGLDYHCDGSDLIGLLCLQTASLSPDPISLPSSISRNPSTCAASKSREPAGGTRCRSSRDGGTGCSCA